MFGFAILDVVEKILGSSILGSTLGEKHSSAYQVQYLPTGKLPEQEEQGVYPSWADKVMGNVTGC